MEIEILEKSKNCLELKIDNITIAEILRAYLNNNGIEFAAWRREHISKPVIFRIENSKETVQKSVKDAINSINKDLDMVLKEIKK
jgi:DNA-directed RNA polymerase subunit L